MHVIERAGDAPVGSEATGQLPLDLHVDVPRQTPGDPCVEASRNHTSWSLQELLTGDAVPVSDLQNDDTHPAATTPRRRDPNKATGKEKAAQHPAQASLGTWEIGSEWVFNPKSTAVINEYADSIIVGVDKPLKAEMGGGESVVIAPNIGGT